MDKIEKITSRLNKIEKTLSKMRQSNDIDFGTLDEIESQLNEIFDSLDEREAELLGMDVRDEDVKIKLIECANCVSTCDRLWNTARSIGNEPDEELLRDEREDLEMMFPDEDIDSDDFEGVSYHN